MVLKVSNGKKTTWPVKQKLVFCGRNWKAIIYCGWIEFARSNNLEVGDVCVFILLNGIEATFEVEIFRVNGNSKPPNSSGELGIFRLALLHFHSSPVHQIAHVLFP